MHYTDQTYLKEKQYKDASSLNARMVLHQRFGEREGEVGWHRWLFDHYDLPEKSRVLELGCGPGTLWAENADRIPDGWDVTLSDLSAGMLKEAKLSLKDIPHRFDFTVMDAQVIPFEDGFFDMVIANHVFHHISDPDLACAEIRRVLKPEGRVYAAMNAATHLQELSELAAHLMDGASLKEFREVFEGQAFRLEQAEALFGRYFNEVSVHRPAKNDLYLTEAEPLIAYFLSMNASETFKQLGEEVTERLAAFKAYLNEQIAERGSIHITRRAGLLEAHSPR